MEMSLKFSKGKHFEKSKFLYFILNLVIQYTVVIM